MKLRIRWVTLIVGAALGIGAMDGAASAQSFIDGNKLLQQCANANTQRYCVYYVGGVWDATLIAQTFSGAPQRGRGCINFQAVNSQQAADVVMRWLQAHPELRHAGAGGLVIRALSEAWPCPME